MWRIPGTNALDTHLSNEASVIRLMGALLMEQDKKWQAGRKYFDMDLYYQAVKTRLQRALQQLKYFYIFQIYGYLVLGFVDRRNYTLIWT